LLIDFKIEYYGIGALGEEEISRYFDCFNADIERGTFNLPTKTDKNIHEHHS
jgi:hypothetical protein